jgi:hypothetical protein
MKTRFVTEKDRKSHFAASVRHGSVKCAVGAVVCVLVLLAQPCIAQSTVAKYSFQKVQMPTAAEVKLAWQTPPSEYGPEPYFGMNGAVTIQSLAHDLDTMKSLGFHAVTAQAAGVLRLLQAIRGRGQEARHEGVDCGRHRLPQRVRRRALHAIEGQA